MPFTEAERKRLLELVDKDDLTLEEAEELHNLARKFYREYIEKTPDAWKVLYYAAAKRGSTQKARRIRETTKPTTNLTQTPHKTIPFQNHVFY